jgi:hypothetical protein
MSFTATVENGAIKLPPGVALADGALVRVEPIDHSETSVRPGTLAERYAEFIGVWKDGPTDAADNHDHYLYGAPKRVP